jgi:cobalt-zinc-cadmium resistance protein CzcA
MYLHSKFLSSTKKLLSTHENSLQNLENQFNVAVKQYEVQKTIVDELERIALPNGKLIFETAQKQFLNGDINYLDWALLVNQSIAIQSNYQDEILKLNENTIQLIYLLNGN